MTPVNIAVRWMKDCLSVSVVNYIIVTNSTIRQPGYNIAHHTFSLLNSFRVHQGTPREVTALPNQRSTNVANTMDHKVDTKYKCNLQSFHVADDSTIWSW